MQIDERTENNILILVPHGDIDLETSPRLREVLKKKAAAKTPKLVLDFSNVPYIDSSGLATLIEYIQESGKFQGKIVLASPSARVKSVFEIVRLDQIFSLYPNLEAALASL